jgi:hypothetical protein
MEILKTKKGFKVKHDREANPSSLPREEEPNRQNYQAESRKNTSETGKKLNINLLNFYSSKTTLQTLHN